MAYADTIRTTDYTREELATLIDGNRFVSQSVQTTGTQPNFTVTLTPAPSAYFDGMTIVIQIHQSSNGSSTINVNGLGAKNIVIPTYSTNSRADSVFELNRSAHYTLSYDASLDVFILHNPTFGTRTSYLPTISVPTGTIDWYLSNPSTYNGSNYTFLNHRTVSVNIEARLGLSVATAAYIDFTLPVGISSNETYIPGSVNYASITGHFLNIGYNFMFASPDLIRLYLADTASFPVFPIDNNFYIRGKWTYEID